MAPVNRALPALIAVGLAIQAFVHYFGQVSPAFRIGDIFYATAIARTLVPAALLIGVLRVPFRQLGFGWPRIPRRELLPLAGLMILGTVVALGFLQLESYQDAYAGVRFGDAGARFRRWALFTLSATVPWELWHRGFLLHGARELCSREGIPTPQATWLAILFTQCFEVLFHFSKPLVEALGFLIGSPVLSLLAFRYRSLWVPALIHLWLELLWFVYVWQ